MSTDSDDSNSNPIVDVVEEIASVDVESSESEENETSIVDAQGRRIELDDEPDTTDLGQE